MPIRSAPLPSPAGTWGADISGDVAFNAALGCWEYSIVAGGEEVSRWYESEIGK